MKLENLRKVLMEEAMNYKLIKIEEIKKINQYKWFRKFSNPCYGFNVKMDVTKLLRFTKENHQSFLLTHYIC